MSMIDYERATTALVLVDPYNDFLTVGGKIWPRIKEVAEATDTNRHLRELVSAVRAAGMRVFIAPHRRWRPGDFEGWLHPTRPHAGLRDSRAFEHGTWGGEFAAGLGPQDGDVVCSEHWAANGFAQTDLDLLLRQHGVQHIILAGMTAPGCVEGTARYAVELGYSVTLVRDATATFSLELMRAAHEHTGPFFARAIVTTREVIAALPAGEGVPPA